MKHRIWIGVAALLLAAVALGQDPTLTRFLRNKGDLLTHGSGQYDLRLAVGTNGHVLTADSSVTAGVKWAAVSGDHGSLSGLSDDDHLQYALLAGRPSGQSLIGGTGVGDDLTLTSTSNVTKGSIIIPLGSVLEVDEIAAVTSNVVTVAGVNLESNTVLASTYESSIATGTAPLTVASTTVVSNLNADFLDGTSSAGFQAADADLGVIGGLARTRGDVIVGGASDWTDLAIGAAGTVLKSDGTDASWGAPGAGSGGAMTLIGSGTVSGAAVTSVQFTSLTLAQGEQWVVFCAIYNSTAGVVVYRYEFNSDTTLTNYFRQAVVFNNAAVGAARANTPDVTNLSAGDRMNLHSSIARDMEGRTRTETRANYEDPANMKSAFTVTAWNVTTDPTSLEIVADTASGIGIGSTFRIYKISGSWFLFIPLGLFRRRRYTPGEAARQRAAERLVAA